MIETILRSIDIIFGTIGLLLLIQVLMIVFKVSNQNPVLHSLTKLTNPLIQAVKRILGIPNYSSLYLSGPALGSHILDPIIALVSVWILRTILVWIVGLGRLVPIWALAPLANIGDILRYLLHLIFALYTNALFLRIIFQWLQVPYSSRIMRFLWDITEPVLTPIRQILPPMMGIDFSPLIAFFLLRMLEGVVITLLSWIF